MKRKVLAFLTSMLLLCTMMPLGVVGVSAATSGTTGDCTWTLNGTNLTISGNGEMGYYTYSYSNGLSTSAPWGKYITSVTIEDGVTGIGNYAFYNCDYLTSATIPDSVTTIGSSAFGSCDALTSVYITDIVAWCAIRFDSNPLAYAKNFYLNGQLVTSLVIPDSVTTIKKSTFAGCTSLTSVTIPDSVTTIGDSAFKSCTNLTSVTIPGSVTTIGSYAFNSCTSLTSVTIPDSVTTIGSYAFYKCTALTSVTIPDNVTSVSDYLFCDCTALTSVTIPAGVTTIGKDAFSNTNLTDVYYGNNETEKGKVIIDSSNTILRSATWHYAIELGPDETVLFAGGKGVEAYPFLIGNSTHLNNMRQYPGGHFQLVNDVIFTEEDYLEGGAFYNDGDGWVPFNFYGVLDGNGHAIHNLRSVPSNPAWDDDQFNASMFDTVYGKVMNLGLENVYMVADSSIPDGVCAAGFAVSGGTYINCYVTGTILAKKKVTSKYDFSDFHVRAGGFTCSGGTFFGCSNYANVEAYTQNYFSNGNSATAGGITAVAYTDIQNCHNYGSVTAQSYNSECEFSGEQSQAYVGGIAGVAFGSIAYCSNYGSITGYAYLNTNGACRVDVGGIVGNWQPDSYKKVWVISDCYNAGTIEADGNCYYAPLENCGGLIGEVYFYSYYSAPVVERCYNIGTVQAATRRGGLIGKGKGADYEDPESTYQNPGFPVVTDCFYIDTVAAGCSDMDAGVPFSSADELVALATQAFAIGGSSGWVIDQTHEITPVCFLSQQADYVLPDTGYSDVVGHSVRETTSGNGLAFRFELTASVPEMEPGSLTKVDYTNATINYLGAPCKLIMMGAVLTNNASIGSGIFTLDDVDGSKVLDVPVQYLQYADENGCAYATRILNISAKLLDRVVYARPYYIVEVAGEQLVVYGDIDMASCAEYL